MSIQGTVLWVLGLCSGVAGQAAVAWSPLGDGSQPGDATLYGLAVSAGGDVDGDGIGDFAVGATGAAGEDGRVYVHSGATGALLLGGPIAPQPPPAVTGGHYQFGAALDVSRDFNGDGLADLVVGAPQVSGLTNARGFVSLVDGASGATLASWEGAVAASLGAAVAAGDVNGDGVPDVIAGARGAAGGAGQVVAYSGLPPYGLLYLKTSPSPVSGSGFGRALAAGDVNGDGFADAIVGADEPGAQQAIGTGFVQVLLGPAGNPAPWGSLSGVLVGDRFGLAVANAGDGFADAIVGADEPGAQQAIGTGFVQVLLGPAGNPAPWGSLSGVLVGDRFGLAVANAGDSAHDADAFDDILVGAPQLQSGNSVGYVRLHDGLTGALLREYVGEEPKDFFGQSVAGRLDFNGDGWLDVAVGAVQLQPSGKRGYLRVHSGKPGIEPAFLYRREGDPAGVAGAGSGVGLGRALAVLGPTSPFTTDTLVATSSVYAGVGHAEVVSGRNLLLTVVPDAVSVGEIVSLVSTQLAPGTLQVMLGGLPPAPLPVHPVLGVALLPQTLFIAATGPDESLLLSGTIPPSLAGAHVLLQVAAKPAGELIRVSDIQSVQF